MKKELVNISNLSEYKKKKIRKWIENTDKKNPLPIILSIVFAVVIIGAFSTIFILNISKPIKKANAKVKEPVVDYHEAINVYNNLFLGDSITHAYDLNEYFPGINTVNSGVNGDNTDMILDDMYERVYKYNPTKVFLLIGTNDIRDEHTDEHIVNNIEKIINEIKKNRSKAKIFVISVYPVNRDKDRYEEINMVSVGDRTNDRIQGLNKVIKEMCKKNNTDYINIYDELTDEDGNLDIHYTLEGLHLTEDAYVKITNILSKYLEKEEIKILKERDK